MSEEKLELVTDSALLRAGDLVVLKRCTNCGSDERIFLLRLGSCECHCGRPAWFVDGGCHHQFAPGNAIAERRLYRVIIPPAEEQSETARPKKLERVR